jgi:hypothetical protein
MNRCSLGVKILILENTGRYRFPEILIEVRAAFLELQKRRNHFAPFRHSGTKNRVIGLETL